MNRLQIQQTPIQQTQQIDHDDILTNIETIINQYQSDHVVAFYLIEDIIKNYRTMQLIQMEEEFNKQHQPVVQPNHHNDDNNYNDNDLVDIGVEDDYNSDDYDNSDNADNFDNFDNANIPIAIPKTTITQPKPVGTIECKCCYELFMDDEVSQCCEGHIICKSCIKKFASQMIYENADPNILCISTESVCQAKISENVLENVLDQRVFNEYKRIKVVKELKEISNAFDDINIKICANCEKGVDIGDFELEVMTCTECFKDTCLKCNQLDHPGKKCFSNGNVRADKRLEIEDKLTEELLIRCDNCNKMIFKDQGCNKVTCTCKTVMCAICKENITKTGYKHFEKSKKCALFIDEQKKKQKIAENFKQDNEEANKLIKSLL